MQTFIGNTVRVRIFDTGNIVHAASKYTSFSTESGVSYFLYCADTVTWEYVAEEMPDEVVTCLLCLGFMSD